MDLSDRDLTKLREASAILGEISLRRDLPNRTLEAVGGVIECDVLTYNEVTSDPDGITYLVLPEATALDDDAFLAHFDEHPLIEHSRNSRGPEAIQIADFLDRRSFHRLGLYQEFFRPAGIEHQIVLSIPTDRRTVLGVALNRDSDRFTERERALLDLLCGPILAARRYLAVRGLAAAALEATEVQGRAGGTGVVLLDGSGTPRFTSSRARELLSRCFGGSDRDRLPPPLAAWAVERLRRASGVGAPEGPGFRAIGHGGEVLCELTPGADVGSLHTLLVRSSPLDVDAALRGRYALTRRQLQILGLLAKGLSDKQIAAELNLSPRTVQKHLQGAYRRLDVVSRSGAMALIAELRGI
jgi:DNA-binding CsgD family transcriptional regulator